MKAIVSAYTMLTRHTRQATAYSSSKKLLDSLISSGMPEYGGKNYGWCSPAPSTGTLPGGRTTGCTDTGDIVTSYEKAGDGDIVASVIGVG